MCGQIILWFIAVTCCVQHVIGEDLQLRETLKLHRKPVVKIIKTKYGDEYNCIDFYKQPAFDHPNLRNRASEFKMRPSSTSSQDPWIAKIWENGKGCPSGTVPIRRYTKEHLIRASTINKIQTFNLNLTRNVPSNAANSFYHYAKIQKDGRDPIYGGIAMHASLHNPRVQDSEYSSSVMRISGGSDFIQTGWTVNPSLNHDHSTRLCIFTMMNGKSCFNDLCPGFVRDSSNVPIDFVFEEISVIRGQAYDWSFTIARDQSNGNWVLKFGTHESNVSVGYWPKNIFTETGLGRLATGIEWGGEVYSPMAIGDLPEMGSGYHEFLLSNQYTAFVRLLQVQNEAGQMVDAPDGTSTFPDYPYKVSNVMNNGSEILKQLFFFGGPITTPPK